MYKYKLYMYKCCRQLYRNANTNCTGGFSKDVAGGVQPGGREKVLAGKKVLPPTLGLNVQGGGRITPKIKRSSPTRG